MSGFRHARKWVALPSRLALLLGVGALSAGSARADAAPIDQIQPQGIPQPSAAGSADLRIWSEGGRVHLSDSGAEATELHLGDTAEARHLRQLLERHGATEAGAGIRLDRMILAGGGGDGFHWAPPGQKLNAGRQGPSEGVAATQSGTGSPAARPSAPTTPASIAKPQRADKD